MPESSDFQPPLQHQPPSTWQARFFQVALIGCAVAGAIWLIVRLSVVTTPILMGFFVAYALNPIVVRLRRWHVPPFLALTVPVLLAVALLVVFFVLVVPQMGQQLLYASEHLPQRLYNAELRLDPWFEQHVGRKLTDIVQYQNLSQVLQSLAKEAVGPAESAISWVLASARDILVAAANLLLIVVVAFFLLEDFEPIVAGARSLVPLRHAERATHVLGRIDEALAGFLRGEALLLTSATLCFSVGLLLLDAPFALVMGPIAGAIYLIPYLGILTGSTLCVLMSLLTDHSSWQVTGVALLFGGFYAVDLLYITPRLIGNRVGLRPVVVLLGIIAMGELAGLIGVLLAVPLLAIGRILVDEALLDYRKSPTYLNRENSPD